MTTQGVSEMVRKLDEVAYPSSEWAGGPLTLVTVEIEKSSGASHIHDTNDGPVVISMTRWAGAYQLGTWSH